MNKKESRLYKVERIVSLKNDSGKIKYLHAKERNWTLALGHTEKSTQA